MFKPQDCPSAMDICAIEKLIYVFYTDMKRTELSLKKVQLQMLHISCCQERVSSLCNTKTINKQ